MARSLQDNGGFLPVSTIYMVLLTKAFFRREAFPRHDYRAVVCSLCPGKQCPDCSPDSRNGPLVLLVLLYYHFILCRLEPLESVRAGFSLLQRTPYRVSSENKTRLVVIVPRLPVSKTRNKTKNTTTGAVLLLYVTI